jgi:hypothetical protein
MAKKRRYDPDKTFLEQQPEAELSWQARICKLIREAGGYAERIEFKSKGGCPDIMAATPDSTESFLIECKMGSMKVDPLQKKIFREMMAGGFDIRCLCIYVEGDQIWFICFDFETEKELSRCHPSGLIKMLWG